MQSIASTPRALRLLAISVIARLPLAMFSIGLLVHAQHLTGSFAAAGVVTGAYAMALGVGGPLLGQLVDRRGQTSVLLTSASVSAALLGAVAALPAGAPPAVLVALAAAIGLATPPLGACVRALFPDLLGDPGALRAAYAAEASAVELTWIAGPPLALALGALWSTGAVLAAGGFVLVLATGAFVAQPSSRGWRPAPTGARPRGSSLRTPAMRTLVIVLVAVGVLFGAVEVAVTAAAAALDSTAAAAPLLAAGSIFALGAVLLVAGAAIAPTYATVYAMVDDAAPAGTVTEAFAWLSTAIAVGAAAGAASAGALADQAGSAATFALAAGAGALATLVTALRTQTLSPTGRMQWAT